jgi:hypothetical protein
MRKKSVKLSLNRETLLSLAPPSLRDANGGWPIAYTTVSADSCVGSCGPSYCMKCRTPPASTSPSNCCFPDTLDFCEV